MLEKPEGQWLLPLHPAPPLVQRCVFSVDTLHLIGSLHARLPTLLSEHSARIMVTFYLDVTKTGAPMT